jgi:hypothetical protein
MLIYEVNLTVDGDVANRYSAWLREHIQDMLDLDGFEAAAWYVASPDGDTIPDGDDVEDPRRWTVHYQVRDAAALQRYLETEADRLRGAADERFDEGVAIDRRILQQQRAFQAQRTKDTGPM